MDITGGGAQSDRKLQQGPRANEFILQSANDTGESTEVSVRTVDLNSMLITAAEPNRKILKLKRIKYLMRHAKHYEFDKSGNSRQRHRR